jgi:hypothetical protein
MTQLINRDNVGMIERAGGTGFLFKTRQRPRLSNAFHRKRLNRDFTVQANVFCAIHLAHAPGAELLKDFVIAEARARRQSELYGIWHEGQVHKARWHTGGRLRMDRSPRKDLEIWTLWPQSTPQPNPRFVHNIPRFRGDSWIFDRYWGTARSEAPSFTSA